MVYTKLQHPFPKFGMNLRVYMLIYSVNGRLFSYLLHKQISPYGNLSIHAVMKKEYNVTRMHAALKVPDHTVVNRIAQLAVEWCSCHYRLDPQGPLFDLAQQRNSFHQEPGCTKEHNIILTKIFFQCHVLLFILPEHAFLLDNENSL